MPTLKSQSGDDMCAPEVVLVVRSGLQPGSLSMPHEHSILCRVQSGNQATMYCVVYILEFGCRLL